MWRTQICPDSDSSSISFLVLAIWTLQSSCSLATIFRRWRHWLATMEPTPISSSLDALVISCTWRFTRRLRLLVQPTRNRDSLTASHSDPSIHPTGSRAIPAQGSVLVDGIGASALRLKICEALG